MYLKLRDLIGRTEVFDRVVMGHFHDPIDTERWHVNGSFKGGDEFSIGRLYVTNRPCQSMLYVHPTHGIVGSERIYLDEATDRVLRIAEGTWPRAAQGEVK